MLKASFAFGIMNCIFFAITAFLLLFMHRRNEKEVVVKETYSRRRSHDSRSVFVPSFPTRLVVPYTDIYLGEDTHVVGPVMDITEALGIIDHGPMYEHFPKHDNTRTFVKILQ